MNLGIYRLLFIQVLGIRSLSGFHLPFFPPYLLGQKAVQRGDSPPITTEPMRVRDFPFDWQRTVASTQHIHFVYKLLRSKEMHPFCKSEQQTQTIIIMYFNRCNDDWCMQNCYVNNRATPDTQSQKGLVPSRLAYNTRHIRLAALNDCG